jgi:hypothetical protein
MVAMNMASNTWRNFITPPFLQHNDLEFSGEHRGSAATEVIVRRNSWLDSSSKKPSADRNDKESYRQRRQFLPV